MNKINLTSHLMEGMQTNRGEHLLGLSFQQPVLLVFLRHFGCTFCRQALADLKECKQSIEKKGTKLVFVHMSDNETAEEYFAKYEIKNPIHISDEDCKYYAAFGLTKGKFTQLFGLRTWIRGFSAGVVDGHGLGNHLGDSFQMPGVFVIKDGKVMASYIHEVASDRPDYELLVANCTEHDKC